MRANGRGSGGGALRVGRLALACGVVLALGAAGYARVERALFGDARELVGPVASIVLVVIPGCDGCEQTIGNLAALARRAPDLARRIVAVSRGDSASTADLGMRLGYPFPIVEEGEAGLGAATGGTVVPILRAFDREGRLVAERFGPRDAESDSAFVARHAEPP